MKEYYTRMLDSQRVCFWASSVDGTEQYLVGQGARLLTGYEPEEFLKRPTLWFELIPPEDHNVVMKNNEVARAEKVTVTFSCRMRHKDGGLRWVNNTVIPDINEAGQVIGVYGFAIDITRNKQIGGDLSDIGEQHRDLLENYHEGATIVANGKIVYVNPVACRMFGASERSLMGRSLADLVAPENRRMFKSRLAELLKGGSDHAWQSRALKKDGGACWVELSSRLIRYEGRPAVLSFIQDITDQKKTQELLDRTTDELASTVTRLKQLSRHILQVQEETYRSVSRDLHDSVAQSINGVRMTLERIKGNRVSGNPSMPSTHRQEIQGCISHLKQITQEIRQLSKQMRPEVLDELGLVAALKVHAQDFQDRTGIPIDFRADPIKKRIPPEAEIQIYRIAQEAMNNIGKHARASHVKCSLKMSKTNLVLDIVDNGVGFSRARGVKNEKHKGIGLTSLTERARLLGGNIEIISAKGKGTKVTLTIPLRR